MRLTELTRYYNFDQPTVDAAREYYITRGKPTYDPYVYKMRYSASSQQTLFDKLRGAGWDFKDTGFFSMIFTRPDKPYILKINDHYDRAFAWFALLTRKFPSIYYPKIGNMKVIHADNKKYYIYLIERLTPTTGSFRNTYAADFRWIAESPKYDLEELFEDKEILKYFKKRPKLVEALRICGTYAGKFRIDIHKNNIMMRSDIPVIIDPYADRDAIGNYTR